MTSGPIILNNQCSMTAAQHSCRQKSHSPSCCFFTPPLKSQQQTRRKQKKKLKMQNHSDPEPKPATAHQVVLNMQHRHHHHPQLEPNSNKARRTLTRLPAYRPKSRFLELNYPPHHLPATPRPKPEPEPEPDSDSDSDFDDDDYPHPISDKLHPTRRRRLVGPRAVIELIALIALTALLISALTVPFLNRGEIWKLRLWEWAVMLLVVLCGRLVANWLVWIAVFSIEKNFPLKEKVLYFVYGLRRSVRSCVWLGLVLLAWTLLFDRRRVQESPAIREVSRALIAVLIAATIWLVKIVLVKVLASSFHVATFFDRMKESVFHHYILEILSGDPIGEEEGNEGDERGRVGWGRERHVARARTMPARAASRRIDIERLRRLSTVRASACSVRRLVGHVMRTGLSTVSRTVDRASQRFGEAEADITSEWEARVTAERIFKNVVRPGNKYIEEEDLRKFLTEEEVQTIFPLFDGALETGKIKKSAFRDWVVRAYRERKSLAHALNDTKTAVQQLHKLASAVVSVIIVIVTLLVMEVASTKVFVAVTSQLLLVGFLFQNTGKTIFESIVFVFVVHPFDAGDRCVIDGVHLTVEEMNILTTVFLRYDNEKIYYPNSVLLTKPISNFYRSPDMGDTIEFAIDVSTDAETIASFRKSIQMYLESKPKYWQAKHSVLIKEIENVNKMKMALNVLHTMNYQNFPERNNRRSELVFELKKIFESLGIKYHLLPQEVHLTQLLMAEGRIPPPISAAPTQF